MTEDNNSSPETILQPFILTPVNGVETVYNLGSSIYSKYFVNQQDPTQLLGPQLLTITYSTNTIASSIFNDEPTEYLQRFLTQRPHPLNYTFITSRKRKKPFSIKALESHSIPIEREHLKQQAEDYGFIVDPDCSDQNKYLYNIWYCGDYSNKVTKLEKLLIEYNHPLG